MIHGVDVVKAYARGVWYASPYIYDSRKWAVYSPTGVCVQVCDSKREAVAECLGRVGEAMEFKDVQFMTAREKQLVLRAWILFLKSGCKDEKFTKGLYHHLTQHCSFIAHFNRGGFFDTYFVRPEDLRRFLSQFDGNGPCESVEYGSTYWRTHSDYADINEAMIREAAQFIPGLVEASLKAERERDLSQAHALLAKHGQGV